MDIGNLTICIVYEGITDVDQCYFSCPRKEPGFPTGQTLLDFFYHIAEVLLLTRLCKRGIPRYFPKFSVRVILNSLLNFFANLCPTFWETNNLDFSVRIFCPVISQKSRTTCSINRAYRWLASPNRIRSSAKNKWEIIGHSLPGLTPFKFPCPTSSVILYPRISMHRINR